MAVSPARYDKSDIFTRYLRENFGYFPYEYEVFMLDRRLCTRSILVLLLILKRKLILWKIFLSLYLLIKNNNFTIFLILLTNMTLSIWLISVVCRARVNYMCFSDLRWLRRRISYAQTQGCQTRIYDFYARTDEKRMWLSGKASEVWGSISHRDLKSFLFPLTIFRYFFTELKKKLPSFIFYLQKSILFFHTGWH